MSTQAAPTPFPKNAAPLPFRRVLCAVNGSRHAPENLRQALGLLARDGLLTCFAVTDERGTGRYTQASLSPRRAQEATEDVAAMAREAGVAAEALVVHASNVRHALMEEAARHDLLVIGAHGHSRAAGILLGSTASFAAHSSPIPVLAARARKEIGFPGGVLAASAGAADDRTVRIAAQIAAAHGAPLVIGHAAHHYDRSRHDLAEQATAAMELTGSDPVIMSVAGDPAEALVSMAESAGAGLVVTGSASRRGVAALASVSERIAHRSSCSVLVLRHR
jgi:nucleotide-binding universal stress UspA family protein